MSTLNSSMTFYTNNRDFLGLLALMGVMVCQEYLAREEIRYILFKRDNLDIILIQNAYCISGYEWYYWKRWITRIKWNRWDAG